ncbi:EAL domain-containing protein [Nitrincola sp. A-D6]|uniref:EAL domain-containing protein n=1 Tax=Nitrincola sp. A-D6 TaxID=1545442 RepID=UPI00068F53E6|nr:EAL domain-containing protein [Nitrincola sp. A-D6]
MLFKQLLRLTLILIYTLLIVPGSFASVTVDGPKFEQVFNESGVAMLLIEPENGQIVEANPAAVRFYGYPLDVLQQMTIQQINTFTPEQVAQELAAVEAAQRNYLIFRHRLANGDLRTVEVYSRPYRFNNQSLLLSIINDITPGRHVAEDLWHYQEQLETMVDAQVQEIQRNRSRLYWILVGALLTQALVIVLLIINIQRKRQLQRQQKQTNLALTAMATTFAPLSGDDFYQAVCQYLADTLDVDYFFVAALTSDQQRAQVLAGWADGAPIVPFSYALKGTPCEDVCDKNRMIRVEGIQQAYPNDSLLVDLQVQAYIGCVLMDKCQQPLGLLVALSRKPMKNAQSIDTLMQLYVDRISAEMQRSRVEKQLTQMAHFDPLTNLSNRTLLAEYLSHAMAQAVLHEQILAILFIDLDGFKMVNDSYSHAVGDQVLVSLAARMKKIIRDEDALARLGGDEFVAVMQHLHQPNDCLPFLNRLLKVIAEPVTVTGIEFNITASIGVVFYPQHESIEADQLLRQADQAMYQAKQAGKNRYHLFDIERDRAQRDQHEGLLRVRQALEAGELELYYQPKVNMRSREVVGAEALIRWNHPERGVLPPAEFLSLIENHPLAIDVGHWVLVTALDQVLQWRELGIHLPVSVNIDAIHLQCPNFVEQLELALRQRPGIKPYDLQLEILETTALDDVAQVSDIMLACQKLGVGFALDDFGTGYSSLTYLKRLPAELLKIDRSFVLDMLEDPEDLAILDGVIRLAGAFQRQVIAEGVETQAHCDELLKLGCELGQGYAIARPMPASKIPEWLDRWQQH